MKYVSALDPAIDTVAMGGDFDRYVLEADESLLKIRPGETPCVWEVRPIDTLTYLAQIEPEEGPAKFVAAFRHGVVRATNVLTPSGNVLSELVPSDKIMIDGSSVSVMARAQMAEVIPGHVLDVGRLIVSLSFFGPTTSRGLPAPLSLLRAAADLARRQAADALRDSSRPTSGAGFPEAISRSETTKPDSPTIATAEAP